MVPLTFVVEVDRDRIHLLSGVLHQFAQVFATFRDNAGAVRTATAQAYPDDPLESVPPEPTSASLDS